MRQLIRYGITTEKSDLRAHVSVTGKCVYFFETVAAVDAIKNNPTARVVTASQPGVQGVTAVGVLMPPDRIAGCSRVECPGLAVWDEVGTDPWKLSTSEKGRYAELIVWELIRNNRIPLRFIEPSSVAMNCEHQEKQVAGCDITLGDVSVQVKMDWKAGHPGTGYIFLQLAEANPLAMN